MQENRVISLDGVWDFQLGSHDLEQDPDEQKWRSITVPMPWQAQFDDLRHANGVAWYRRLFSVDLDTLENIADRSAVLHFGAVDYQAKVWLNDQDLGEHEGGYLPFEFDIADTLHEGENQLLVRVVDASDDRSAYPEIPFSEVPHGKQSWYGPIGGIWQSVWLEIRPRYHIAQILLDPSPAEATLGIEVALNKEPDDSYQIGCSVIDPEGHVVGTADFEEALTGKIQLKSSPKLWSPETPHLYTVEATLQSDDHPPHTVTRKCGFRTVEACDGRIFLNGEPIYLRGVLDQAYYPETIYTPNSLELLEEQARECKALGFNCLRTHIKIEDPRYYDVADRLGLLVWTEIPNWALLTDAAAKRAKQTFQGMVERDGHHPSIIAWTLVNENWGTDLTRNEEHRQWLADFYREAKAIDPTRLIIDNSACCDNAHVASDLEDFHHYRAIPDHAREWDEWVDQFAGRSNWSWYPDFEEERRSDLPLIVSEFGNWGLPDPATIHENGQIPWWFETGLDWGGGIVYPRGVRQRFEACGLSDLFPSYAEFAQHSQEHMARSLHYEISTMRLQKAIARYVVTEFTDVHWECNGLLTMQRETKYALDPLLKDLNQDLAILLRPKRWNGRPRDTIDVMVQTMGVSNLENRGSIQWQFGDSVGELPAPGGILTLKIESPGVITLNAQWLASDGSQLAVNQVSLVCVASPKVSYRLRVIDNSKLAGALRELGYQVSEEDLNTEIAANELVVACKYTRALITHIQKGGRAFLLADHGLAERSTASLGAPLPVGHLVPREGTAWQGDWATSFSWVKKQGPLAHLPGGPILEMEWATIMPDLVIAELPLWVQRHHSWAGLAVGWIHKAVSLLALLPYGRGHLLVTTFKLNARTLASDATAQALFAGALNLLGGANEQTEASNPSDNPAAGSLPAG